MRKITAPLLAICAIAVFDLSPLALRAVPPRSEETPPTAEQLAGGQALADQIRSSVPEENSQITGTLIIKSNGAVANVPIDCTVVVHGTNWEADYLTGVTATRDAAKYIVIHSSNGPNEYFYAKAPSPSADVPKPRPISASEANIPVGGSDFSLADLGLEYLHWPVQRQLKGVMRLGQPCYVLESSNTRPAEIVRVKSFIDKEYKAPLIVEGFDAGGHLVKEFSLSGSSFRKVNGQAQMRKMDIYNIKTRSHTELKFDLKE